MHNKYFDKFKGICSVLVTPLHKDETLDEEGFERLVNYQNENDINSIFICGSFGEGPTISNDVRKRALNIALKNFEDKPILVGIFESGTKKVIQTIDDVFGSIGIKENVFLTIAPPIYFAPAHNENELLRFYKEVSSRGIPVVIYNNTTYTGLSLTVDLILKLSEVENVMGIKYTKEPLENLKKIIENVNKKKFRVGYAKNRGLVDAFEMGVDILVNVTPGIIPKTFSDLYSFYQKRQIKEARSLEEEITSFENIYSLKPNAMAVAKVAVNLLIGGCESYMTPPFESASEEQKIEIKKFLQSKNLIL